MTASTVASAATARDPDWSFRAEGVTKIYMTTRLITQLLVFAMFGFTPILLPVWQLPGWLGTVNWWLPFGHMATIVRAGLTTGMTTGLASSYLVVAAWGAACAVVAAWAMGRRR
jgi:ABC-2 type transport system permease protein